MPESEDTLMAVLFLILIIVPISMIGFYFVDHCVKFMEAHYKGSLGLFVLSRGTKKTGCGTMTFGIQLFRKG